MVEFAGQCESAAAGHVDGKGEENSNDRYRLGLDSAEKSRFPVARVTMRLTEIGLKDAFEAADNSPIVLESGLTKSKTEEAET